jgi:hypothetical protein
MMTGCSVTSGSKVGCLGDEEHVNVLPPAQFLSKYIFFTDPTYPTTNLVLTRAKAPDGSFKDVKIACLGTVKGWKAVGSTGKYQVTDVDLVRSGSSAGTCTNGPQTATSDGPFGLTVWGLDDYSSYAYPAGGNLATINSVYVPPTPQ